jgi:hypothetical protein
VEVVPLCVTTGTILVIGAGTDEQTEVIVDSTLDDTIFLTDPLQLDLSDGDSVAVLLEPAPLAPPFSSSLHPLSPPPRAPPDSPELRTRGGDSAGQDASAKNDLNLTLYAAAGGGGLLIICCLLALCCYYRRRNLRRQHPRFEHKRLAVN